MEGEGGLLQTGGPFQLWVHTTKFIGTHSQTGGVNIGGSSFTDCSFRERLERQIKGGGGSEGGVREREGGRGERRTDRQTESK